MKLVITGATGFFGKALLRYLENYTKVSQITIISRDPKRFIDEVTGDINLTKIKFIKHDISNSADIKVEGTHFLHAATDSSIVKNNEERMGSIIDGTRNALDICRRNNINRFLLTSSGGVYGKAKKSLQGFTEDDAFNIDTLDVNNLYSIGKIASENLCAYYKEKYNINYIIARCFSFIGKDLPLDVHFVLGQFIKNALNSEDIIINGDGGEVRSYMNQIDLAKCLMQLLENKKCCGIYNLGSDENMNLLDIAKLVKKIIKPDISIIVKNKIRNNNRRYYYPDIKKLRNHCEIDPLKSLEESLYEFQR